MSQRPRRKSSSYKTLRREIFMTLDLGDGFLDITQKAQQTKGKIDKLDFI